jgi:prepilin-type N-terminal cleavage/methylation domain-containing protein
MTRDASDRRGFTLVELLIVAVLGGLIVVATYQVLLTNQRTYTVNNQQIHDQQTLRASMDILFGEIRELSAGGGDLELLHPHGFRARAMRAFGLVCQVNVGLTPPKITVKKVGRWFEGGDSIFLFADNDTELAGDDVWLTGVTSNVDTTGQTCSGTDTAQVLSVPALASSTDSVRIGAPVRAYRLYTYGYLYYMGEYYLGRMEGYSTPVPMVGPIRDINGMQFTYYDEDGNVTAVPANVAQIEVTIRTQSGVRNSQGNLIEDSITGRVNLRN